MEHFSEEILTLERYRKKTILLACLLYVIAAGAAFGISAAVFQSDLLASGFALSLLFVFLVYRFFIKKRAARFHTLFYTQYLPAIMQIYFSEVSIHPDLTLRKELIEKGAMLKTGNTYEGNHLISANYDGIDFHQCYATFQTVTIRSKKGVEKRKVKRLFSGRYILMDFHKKTDAYLQIRDPQFDHAQKTSASGYAYPGAKKTETENIEFNRQFQIVSTDQTAAFYILTPQFMESLLRIKTKLKEKIMIAFIEGKMHIAVTGFGRMRPRWYMPLIGRGAEFYSSEICILKEIADELRLGTEIFRQVHDDLFD